MKKSEKEQLDMFNQPNAGSLVREYIIDGLKLYYAISMKSMSKIPGMEKVMALHFGFDNPPEVTLPKNFSKEEKMQITCGDYLYQEAQMKIWQEFPREVAIELIILYGRTWELCEKVQMTIVQTSTDEEILKILQEIRLPCEKTFLQAFEIISSKEIAKKLAMKFSIALRDIVLKKVIAVLPSKDAKDVLLEYIEVNTLSDEVQKEMTEKMERDDARIILMKAMLFHGTKLSKASFEFLEN